MAKLDRVLDGYDLAALERAMQHRRDREHRRLVAMVEKLQSDVTVLASRKPVRGVGTPLRRPNARRLNDISLAEALVQVMQGRKKPIHYRDLTDTVVKKKLYVTKSKNLLSTVAVTLKRDGRFKKVEPGFYSLR